MLQANRKDKVKHEANIGLPQVQRRFLTAGIVVPGSALLARSARAMPRISVRDYGAVGDGVNNDSPAIRAAFRVRELSGLHRDDGGAGG